MESSEKRRIVEALILSSSEPLPAAKIAEIVPYCDAGQAKDLVNELNTEYADQDRAFEIWEVAGGFQIRTRAEFSGYLQKLQKERALRLSQAALETLAIIAYRQPVTRAEIEDVRGVDAGATVKSLLERHLIRIAGQREVPGRPMLYGTTRRFLEVFGLERLKDLPSLRELDELAREQGLLEKTADNVDVPSEAGTEPAVAGDEQAAASDPQAEASGEAEGVEDAENPLGDGDAAAKQAADSQNAPERPEAIAAHDEESPQNEADPADDTSDREA
jgi:segregation and condensation protein B